MQNGKPLLINIVLMRIIEKTSKDIKIPPTLAFENEFVKEAKIIAKSLRVLEFVNILLSYNFWRSLFATKLFLKEVWEFWLISRCNHKDIKQSFLFHSNISSSLNIGLIDLNELIEKIVNSKAPYNAKRVL